jgi:hypothetical protein
MYHRHKFWILYLMTLVAVSAAYRFCFSVAQNAVTSSDIEITVQSCLFLRKMYGYEITVPCKGPHFQVLNTIFRYGG